MEVLVHKGGKSPLLENTAMVSLTWELRLLLSWLFGAPLATACIGRLLRGILLLLHKSMEHCCPQDSDLGGMKARFTPKDAD